MPIPFFTICQRSGQGMAIPQIQSRFTHGLEQMIVTNPALLILVDKLKLIQI